MMEKAVIADMDSGAINSGDPRPFVEADTRTDPDLARSEGFHLVVPAQQDAITQNHPRLTAYSVPATGREVDLLAELQARPPGLHVSGSLNNLR